MAPSETSELADDAFVRAKAAAAAQRAARIEVDPRSTQARGRRVARNHGSTCAGRYLRSALTRAWPVPARPRLAGSRHPQGRDGSLGGIAASDVFISTAAHGSSVGRLAGLAATLSTRKPPRTICGASRRSRSLRAAALSARQRRRRAASL